MFTIRVKNWRTSILSVIASVVVLLPAAVAAADRPAAARTPSDSESIEVELEIMAKVLEESLGERLGRNWHGSPAWPSPFDPAVRKQHIPTVGAVFTIPVNFPVIAPPPVETGAQDTEEDPGDLWAKHARKRSHAPAHDSLQPDEKYFAIEIGGYADDEEGGYGDDVFRQIGALGGQPYDASRFQTLRETLLGVLARYGHRLEHLAPSENIYLLVDAPKASAQRIRVRDGNAAVKRYSQTLIDAQGFLLRATSRFSRGGAQEHYMVFVKKSELKDATTIEEIEPRVTEMCY